MYIIVTIIQIIIGFHCVFKAQPNDFDPVYPEVVAAAEKRSRTLQNTPRLQTPCLNTLQTNHDQVQPVAAVKQFL